MDKELERNQKYQQLSETLQRLYGSAESGAKLYEIFTTSHLKEEHYPIYIEIVGDTILGYYRLSDIPRLLQQRMILSADQSQRITSKLIDFLSPVVRREEEERKAKTSQYQELAQKVAGVKAPEALDGIEKVEPLRTMETDMHKIHGYGAYVEQQNKAEDDTKTQ